MSHDPLRPPPADSPIGSAFLAHFGLARGAPDAALLERVARAFAQLPYENLTKIIKYCREGSSDAALREPGEVLDDHVRLGTGGTCFSLTALLLHLLRSFGYEARPVLADRRYGPDTHCAALVDLPGGTHLIDPGYLLFKPVPIDAREPRHIVTPFNELVLSPAAGGKLDLATRRQGAETYRLTYKPAGADAAEFMRAWHESFSWDMMRYPLLTRVTDATQRYLQKTHFQERDHAHVARRTIPVDELVSLIAGEFGIARAVAAAALDIVAGREKLDA